MKRAIISVYEKENIDILASKLTERGYEIISTGGTLKYLSEKGIKVTDIEEITKFPEIMDGRVKTLHPAVHGGILVRRENPEDIEITEKLGIIPIDIVVVNLYPFFEKVRENINFEEKIEFIDIGGPTMLRAAAKNFRDVTVITDKEDYSLIIDDEKFSSLNYDTRKKLASKVFNLMSAYDAAISNFLDEDNENDYLSLSYKKYENLRYGENPHQKASVYVRTDKTGVLSDMKQIHGKQLSYNNYKDLDVAWKITSEFEEPFCVGLKHNSPCGAAIGKDINEAFVKAYEVDPVSIYGGIVSLNRPVGKELAEKLHEIFLEIVIAPDFEPEALEILGKKKNLRLLKINVKPQEKYEKLSIDGGILVQEADIKSNEKFIVVTQKKPEPQEIKDMIFGMKIVKYVKSNAVITVKDEVATGIGGGQVNRIWAAQHALQRSKQSRIIASDAFFPFADVVEEAAKYNIKAIIQPGGSVRDKESIEACDRLGIAMAFTGIRHFKH